MICVLQESQSKYTTCIKCGIEYRVGSEPGQCKYKEPLPPPQASTYPEHKVNIQKPKTPVQLHSSKLKQISMKDVTFCITSFERPEHLYRLLKSIRNFYPDAKVLVADYSEAHPNIFFGKLITLEFDTGLSAARNVLATACQTKYMLLLEEDFVFTKHTKIEPMLDIMENDKDQEIGVIGGAIYMNDALHYFDLDLRRYRGKLYAEKSHANYNVTQNGTYYKYCDVIFNFSLFRTEMIRLQRFHDELKVGEHIPYYFEVKQKAEWRVAFTPDTIINHDVTGRSDKYKHFRFRAKKMQDDWFHNHGVPMYKHSPNIYGTVKTSKNNVIILGVGHSGTSILSKMFIKCGYNRNDSDEEFGESVSIRDMNDKIIKYLMYGDHYPTWKQKEIIKNLQEPWVVKDPRFVRTLDKWAHLFTESPPLLIYIKKHTYDVMDSFLRRKELDQKNCGEFVSQLEEYAEWQYSRWPWHKVTIHYEDIVKSVDIFKQPSRHIQLELF